MLIIDFETRSAVPLDERGAHVYAADPTTDIICMGWSVYDQPAELWKPNDEIPDGILIALSDKLPIYAHNYGFDSLIWEHVLHKRYGFPMPNANTWMCSMAMSYAMGLPGKLANVAAVMGLTSQKDMKGNRVMQQISKPRSFSSVDGSPIWWDDAEKFRMTYEYCKTDIVTTRELIKNIRPISADELPVFHMDRRINERGVKIALPEAKAAITLIEQEKVRLDKEMRIATGGFVSSCTEAKRIKQWLATVGVNVEGVSKAILLETLLDRSIPMKARRVMELRQESAKASTAKLDAMVNRVSSDGRIKGLFQYTAAGTGRWAGRGVQVQNLPRTTFMKQDEIEYIFARLKDRTLTAEEIVTFYGSPMSVISECIRGFLVAEEAHALYACDFSAIEARVLAWLSGEEWVLDIFRTHGKIYEAAASAIYQMPMEQVTKAQRQIGKVAELALGFGGGKVAFVKMGLNYGLSVSESSAESIKQAWRASRPATVKYWYALENAAINALKHVGDKFHAGVKGREVCFLKNGSFLLCRLPSGRIIYYPHPKLEAVLTPWGDPKDAVTYMSENTQNRQWERCSTYGGSLAENITQSVARDLLAEAMLRLDTAGWKIIMHAHDEVVCEEIISENKTMEDMESIMCTLPSWGKDLPLSAAGWIGKRYRKE